MEDWAVSALTYHAIGTPLSLREQLPSPESHMPPHNADD